MSCHVFKDLSSLYEMRLYVADLMGRVGIQVVAGNHDEIKRGK